MLKGTECKNIRIYNILGLGDKANINVFFVVVVVFYCIPISDGIVLGFSSTKPIKM